jgi:hypothetical protein
MSIWQYLTISLVLSFAIAFLAGRRGRNPFAWFLISVFATPVIAGILLLLFPRHRQGQAGD